MIDQRVAVALSVAAHARIGRGCRDQTGVTGISAEPRRLSRHRAAIGLCDHQIFVFLIGCQIDRG